MQLLKITETTIRFSQFQKVIGKFTKILDEIVLPVGGWQRINLFQMN